MPRMTRLLRPTFVCGAILVSALFGPTAGRAGQEEAGDPAPSGSVAPPPGPGSAPAYHYCPVCGARNAIDHRFCVKDGTPLPPILEARWLRGFVRSPDTFSPQEIQQVMQAVSRSVVRIRVRTTSTYKYPVAYWKDEEEEYLWHGMLGRIETSDTDVRLAGSGFVIGSTGEIVTNAHVAQPDGQEASLTVETQDGRTFPARILGVDQDSDLALLTIDSDALPPLEWGDSSAVRAGQEAWAIGNPLDIGISIARGTVSGLGGARIGLNQVESFLHSDAHITHGNSGGPLVDVYGHVIGVSDIVYTEEKGQGYSIPSRMAKYVISRLRRDGRYDRGYIGLRIRPIDTSAVKKFSLSRTDGSVVDWVVPDSPAAVAGLQAGDVVLGLEGRLASSTYLLQEAVSSVGAGARITLQIDRHGKGMDVPVTTVSRPEAPRIDPIEDLQGYLRVHFEEDPKTREVHVRNGNNSSHAPGLYDGVRIKSVLPAQDWPEEAITLNYYKTRAHPLPIHDLEDLRAALRRAYVAGRVAVTFETDYPPAPIASVAFDVLWPILL